MMVPDLSGHNFCSRCESWYATPRTCNCFDADGRQVGQQTVPVVPLVPITPYVPYTPGTPVVPYPQPMPYSPGPWIGGPVAPDVTITWTPAGQCSPLTNGAATQRSGPTFVTGLVVVQ